MINTFQLVGLSAPKSFTCFPVGKEDIFWATSDTMTDQEYKQLFDKAKTTDDYWKTKRFIEIEYFDQSSVDGVPINGKVVRVINP